MYRKEIVYDRGTRDYAMYLDSELVGFARTYHKAEVTLDQLVFELLSGANWTDATAKEAPALVDDGVQECTINCPGCAFCTTEVHARMAEPAPEFVEVVLCSHCAAPATTHLIAQGWPPLCDDCCAARINSLSFDLDNQAASDAFPEEPIGECVLDGAAAWRLDETLTAPLCPDHKAQERTWIANRDGETPDPNDIPPPDGPGAPPNIPSDGRGEITHGYVGSGSAVHVFLGGTQMCGSGHGRGVKPTVYDTADAVTCKLCLTFLKAWRRSPSWKEEYAKLSLTGAPVAPVDNPTPVAPTLPSASQDGAADATQPAASDLDPRATLTALLKASLEEWQSLNIPTPYDVALAQLARLTTPPSGHFLTCGICGGPHYATKCPKVVAEKARQIEQAKWGETMTYLHRHHRELLISSLQSAPLLAERAEALSLHLTHATGTLMPIALVQRHLTQLAQQNAAPTS